MQIFKKKLPDILIQEHKNWKTSRKTTNYSATFMIFFLNCNCGICNERALHIVHPRWTGWDGKCCVLPVKQQSTSADSLHMAKYEEMCVLAARGEIKASIQQYAVSPAY